MPALCFCFAIHEPYILRRYTVFDLGENSIYEDDDRNCDYILRAARRCYLPLNELLLRQVRKTDGAFKMGISISCTALDIFEQYVPEVLDGLKALAATGCVEFFAEPGQHTLAFLYSREDFLKQIRMHAERINKVFGKKPLTFRNTEMIYNNDLATVLSKEGFKVAMAEGADHVLGWRSANYVYYPVSAPDLRLLLRNHELSADISQRFSHKNWDQWPLTADKYADWCAALEGKADILNIFVDGHAFGLRHTKESGIFDFMEALPEKLLSKQCSFVTPYEAAQKFEAKDSVDVPQFMSWDDEGCDLTAWLGNNMQKDAIHALYELAPRIRKIDSQELFHDFSRLQTSDHFHYMSTKWFADFQPDRPNPYESPYDAYITYMNVLADFEMRLKSWEKSNAPVTAPETAKTDLMAPPVIKQNKTPRKKITVLKSRLRKRQKTQDGKDDVAGKTVTKNKKFRSSSKKKRNKK